MQIRIGILGHVVVEHDIDTFDVDTTTEEVRGDEQSLLEVLERLVTADTLGLLQRPVDGNRREVLLAQQVAERDTSLHRLDEDDDLVELEIVEQLEQVFVLLLLGELDIVLLESVQRQLRVVVDEDLQWLERGREKERLIISGLVSIDYR